MSAPKDVVREKLCELVVRFGTSVCEEVPRCEGLLRDLCPGHRAEVNLLVTALRERVVSELVKPASSGVPVEFLLGRLGKRLEEEHGLTADAARWAVESWALALGRITAADLSRQDPVKAGSRASSAASIEPDLPVSQMARDSAVGPKAANPPAQLPMDDEVNLVRSGGAQPSGWSRQGQITLLVLLALAALAAWAIVHVWLFIEGRP